MRSIGRSIGASLIVVVLLTFTWWAPPGAGRAAAQPSPEAYADCNIWWNEVLHDTFDANYRSVVGPTTPDTTIRLRLRVAQSDITSARVRVWDDRTNTETYETMAWDGGFDTDPYVYDWWFADVAVGSQPTILYYFFEINDNGGGSCPSEHPSPDTDWYTDDEPKFYGGGYGAVSDDYNDMKSFQLTVYDPSFSVPSWMQRAVIYQIFPDRFRDGDDTNNPLAGRFFYGSGSSIVRSGQADWNYTVCDPRSVGAPACPNHYSDNFYGGDLQGIIDKINDGYFDSQGVTVLYLNPIFRSPSNHKYDTADYMAIDPDFGTLATFQALVAAADSHGLKIILDGVFNHTSSDSKYFDYYKRYDAGGNLTSPSGPGTDDNSGACESPVSGFRDWFYIGGTPANPAAELCDPNDGDDPSGSWTQQYEAWYGYGSLPKLQANTAAVRALIWANGLASAGPYWTDQGAGGWRFDVGGDVDPGLTNDPSNSYWEGFRSAVRGISADTVTLGEEWGDASAWLLGGEWDSVMNYRFRSAVLSWLFTGCSGSGCSGGAVFEDNDSNSGSSSGAISAISPSQFNARLRSIQEDYPPQAFKAMMNLEGSHDTNRLRFLLKKINNDSDSDAVQRMKEWWIFAFAYAGAPMLYYGDEVGLSHDGVWASSKWEDDPYNRTPFPWPDATGTSYSADTANLQSFARTMASIRHSYRALQDGDVQHGLIINDAQKLYGFARTGSSQTALIALNRDNADHTATFNNLNAGPYNLVDGTLLVNALNGSTYTVSGGSVSVPVTSNWGVVLLEQAKIDVPRASTSLSVSTSGNDVILGWPAVILDTNLEPGREAVTLYSIHRDVNAAFTPDATNRIGTVTPPPFGGDDGTLAYTHVNGAGPGYTYAVCAYNHNGDPDAPSPDSCFKAGPTAAKLVSFVAAPAAGTIHVEWETATEIDNVGFNLYRSDAAGGVYARLNDALIPSQAPGSPAGAVYRWLDGDVRPGQTYYYKLEPMDIHGVATLHGPVWTTLPAAFRLYLPLVWR